MLDKKTLRSGIIRATIFTVLTILLVLAFNFPIYYGIILIAFFWIKIFPFTKFIDKKLMESYPSYKNSHPILRKAVPYAIYILFIIVMKTMIVDIFMSEFLHIPVKEQLYEFLNLPNP